MLKLSVWGSKCGPCLESNIFTERTGARRQMTGRTTLRVIRSVPSGSDGAFAAHEATTSLAVLSAHTFTTLPQQGSNPVSSSSLSGSFATKQRIHSSYLPQPSLPYHARVVPILQSTGFGKSKLCVHLSAQQAGLLACVHQHRPFQPQPFPSQDRVVYNYFHTFLDTYDGTASSKKPSEQQHDHSVYARVACFLAAYCKTLYLYLKNLMRVSGCFCRHALVHLPIGQCHGWVLHSLAKSPPTQPARLLEHQRLCSPLRFTRSLTSSMVYVSVHLLAFVESPSCMITALWWSSQRVPQPSLLLFRRLYRSSSL